MKNEQCPAWIQKNLYATMFGAVYNINSFQGI